MDELAGTWVKETRQPCSSSYPDELELHPGGRYLGRMRAGARVHPRWDVGTYERLPDGRLGISMSNDAIGRYAFERDGDRLILTDEDGCRFAYRRH